jgi:LPXTG-motif cell wall-anchored protein
VKKLMLMLAMLAMVLMMVFAPLAMAQEEKKGKGKNKDKMKEMPKTGGVPFNTTVLGLGAGAMLVGGGLLVRRVTR